MKVTYEIGENELAQIIRKHFERERPDLLEGGLPSVALRTNGDTRGHWDDRDPREREPDLRIWAEVTIKERKDLHLRCVAQWPDGRLDYLRTESMLERARAEGAVWISDRPHRHDDIPGAFTYICGADYCRCMQ